MVVHAGVEFTLLGEPQELSPLDSRSRRAIALARSLDLARTARRAKFG